MADGYFVLPATIGGYLAGSSRPPAAADHAAFRSAEQDAEERSRPTISSFDGMVIRMYSEEHGPPHIHAIYAEHEAVIGITELQVTRGSLPGRRLARVLRWTVDHQAELMDNWELCRCLEPPKPIPPK